MEKKNAKEMLERVRQNKQKMAQKNFDKIVGKPKNTAECRRVNFNK